jgi:hypothetical protein
MPAACATNAAATPQVVSCQLGSSITWNAGDVVVITVPATAGANATTNATNTALVVDDMGRTENDTFVVKITADQVVSCVAVTAAVAAAV